MLEQTAIDYLTSTPDIDLHLLEKAKVEDLKTYEVLPEIGFDDSLHSMFYFEECFKKNLINAKELIYILNSINKSASSKIGNLNYYYKINDKTSSNRILKELEKFNFPFLKELQEYCPSYPY